MLKQSIFRLQNKLASPPFGGDGREGAGYIELRVIRMFSCRRSRLRIKELKVSAKNSSVLTLNSKFKS